MQTMGTMIAGRSVAGFAVRAVIVAAGALLLCGCNTDQQATGIPDAPVDYRMRHPITLHEADHAMVLFIGTNRGELNPTQRAEVLSFGLGWKHEATGGVVVERPLGSGNERAAADAMREVLSLLAASGLAPQNIAVRTYDATGTSLATVHLSYPKIAAQAGPCGMWPENIGPNPNREYSENQQYWNFGCSNQHNLAAMIDNPADLVQPRGETAPSNGRRTLVLEKYRQGQSAATQDPSSSAAKITDFGK